ncbi:hypothetical protein [Spirosoma aerolatum]|uniref:hypothetical protein n=1 Tax=Spirosoma aerolatum TaxID=1211326 RepID=UPI0009ACC516|nr:hypothetical protein [Spirosoma aerolatum]
MIWPILLLSILCHTPEDSHIAGLGRYGIGVTTLDSINRSSFTEVEPVLVKGTLALTCDQVRLFTAQSVDINGLSVKNLSLVFYDGRLFQISCDVDDELQKMFRLNYRQGIHASAKRLNLCGTQTNKLLTIEGESWQDGDVRARLIQARGYDSNCQTIASLRLVISDQRVSALCSACDLSAINPFLEAFDQVIAGHR